MTRHPDHPPSSVHQGVEHQHGAEAPHSHTLGADPKHHHGAGPWSHEPSGSFDAFAEPGPYSSARRVTHPFETS